jgi:secreted PhoX family phosphatase
MARRHDLESILIVHSGRRQVLKAGVAGMLAALGLPGCATRSGAGEPLLGFSAVPVSTADGVRVPPGYRVQVLYGWGDPVGIASGQPAFRWDASNSADDQALQAGMHHDAIEYFPLPMGSQNSTRALLAINHEYTDDGLLHPDGMKTWTAEKVRKSQASHGVSIVEARLRGDVWEILRPSPYARRITGYTPMRFSGPAAGHALLGTGDPLGTLNNCAGGITPWGTYLTCEENFNGYFVNAGTVPPDQRRYGINARGFGYRWHEFDARFDAAANPLEPNRFGWVVEIDPYDSRSVPVKRTALGRFKHEGAMVTLAADGRVVVYMGDDERFEYVYKFVSRDRFNPGNRAANRDLLDHGMLYAARFEDDGSGRWLPLQGTDALIQTRQAADRAGATKMDRPEWVAVHPATKDVYLTLTNNTSRGAKDQPGTDLANPRPNNVFGHIVKWREEGGDPASASFRWDHFVLAGDSSSPDGMKRGNIRGDAFGSPDGLWFDRRGVLWIQTDVSTSVLNRGDYANLGNNQMLAADVATGDIRRFLTGPAGCEITGCTMAPDGRSLFVNIQHPGEPASERSDPASPRAVSNWPDFRPDGRPRSATLVIRREDGGLVGT